MRSPSGWPAAAAGGASPADSLCLAWLGLLGLLGGVARHPMVVVAAAGMASVVILSVRSAARGYAGGLVHDLVPALIVAGSYWALGPLIGMRDTRSWDQALAAVDARAFGVLATLWRNLLSRPFWLTKVASVSYFAFYALPLGIALTLHVRQRRLDLDDFVFRIVATFLVSFLGHLLLPAAGPDPASDNVGAVIGGGVISDSLRTFLGLFERTKWDAFPSDQAAVVTVCAIRAPRLFPRAWPLVLAVALATVFSTVYLLLHYVSDVVAGLGLAFVVNAATPALRRVCRAAPPLETGSLGPGPVPLFSRSDGILVRGETPVRRIMPYLMPGRNESIVFHEATYDVSRASRWLAAHNRCGIRHATLFHLFLCALARTLHARPGLNRFVSGGHLYQRRGVFLSFAAKAAFEEDAPLVTVKIQIPAGEPFAVSVDRIAASVDKARRPGTGLVDKELRLALAIPGFLLRGAVTLLRALDRMNLMPARLIAADPMYTSVFVANLGSLGLSHASHHLYEYGTASVFAAMGRIQDDSVDIHWTFDERVNDGFYGATALAFVKSIMEDPEAHFGLPGASAEQRAPNETGARSPGGGSRRRSSLSREADQANERHSWADEEDAVDLVKHPTVPGKQAT